MVFKSVKDIKAEITEAVTKPPVMKFHQAAKTADKNSRTIVKIQQLLELTQLPGYSKSDPDGHVMIRIELLKKRLNRRLAKLAKWVDCPVEDRQIEFRSFRPSIPFNSAYPIRPVYPVHPSVGGRPAGSAQPFSYNQYQSRPHAMQQHSAPSSVVPPSLVAAKLLAQTNSALNNIAVVTSTSSAHPETVANSSSTAEQIEVKVVQQEPSLTTAMHAAAISSQTSDVPV